MVIFTTIVTPRLSCSPTDGRGCGIFDLGSGVISSCDCYLWTEWWWTNTVGRQKYRHLVTYTCTVVSVSDRDVVCKNKVILYSEHDNTYKQNKRLFTAEKYIQQSFSTTSLARSPNLPMQHSTMHKVEQTAPIHQSHLTSFSLVVRRTEVPFNRHEASLETV